jgi:hypothetical protein
MVAVVNSVVVAARAGLVLEAVGADPLAVPLVCERRSEAAPFRCTNATTVARNAYRPEAVDRAAIVSCTVRSSRRGLKEESP